MISAHKHAKKKRGAGDEMKDVEKVGAKGIFKDGGGGKGAGEAIDPMAICKRFGSEKKSGEEAS